MITSANIYAEDEIRRLERQRPSKQAFYREQWLRERSREDRAEHRALVHWAGDRLVGAGERLRAWSAPRPAGSQRF
jgi:hypothetical protein